MNCQRIRDDYELYVLGALPENERAEFEAHLSECPEAHPELAEAADTLAELAFNSERAPVPDRVASALFARVDADLGARSESAAGVGDPVNTVALASPENSGTGLRALLGSRWTHPAMGLGVVAIALLIVGGVWLDNRLASVESNATELAQNVEALASQDTVARAELQQQVQKDLQVVTDKIDAVTVDQQELATVVEQESSAMAEVDEMLGDVDELLSDVMNEQSDLASQVQTVAQNESEMMDIVKEQRSLTYMAATPNSSVNMLWSSQQSASARGMMFMSSDGRIGILAVLDLPPLPDDLVYQIWLIKDGMRTSIGTFTVDASGYGQTVIQLVAPVGEFDAIGITVEPAGGSSDPTGDQVLVGDL
jgi:anti-sigma-K factor RskA